MIDGLSITTRHRRSQDSHILVFHIDSLLLVSWRRVCAASDSICARHNVLDYQRHGRGFRPIESLLLSLGVDQPVTARFANAYLLS